MRVYYDRDADLNLIKEKKIVIVGYGRVGRGLATRFRGLGARVIVVETTGLTTNNGKSGYHKGLEALYDGNWVSSMEDAANQGDIFITATGSKNVISKHHITIDPGAKKQYTQITLSLIKIRNEFDEGEYLLSDR